MGDFVLFNVLLRVSAMLGFLWGYHHGENRYTVSSTNIGTLGKYEQRQL